MEQRQDKASLQIIKGSVLNNDVLQLQANLIRIKLCTFIQYEMENMKHHGTEFADALSVMTTVLFNCISTHLEATVPYITESRKPELIAQIIDFMWEPAKQEAIQSIITRKEEDNG